MDEIRYIEFLENMSQSQLKDYLESVWKEDIQLTAMEEQLLKQHLDAMRVKKIAVYVSIFLLLLALLASVPEYQGAIRRIFGELPEPTIPDEFDLMWVTKEDELVCKICAPLNGKIIGKNLALLGIRTHPKCRCEIKVVPKKGVRAMNIRTLEAGAVRAFSEGQKRILEVLAAPFGSPDRQDRYKQWFTARTDFMIGMDEPRPLLYLHGRSPRGRRMKNPPSIGKAVTTKLDDKGLWMRAELVPEGKNELADRTWKAALEGNARASTGSVSYLVDPPMDNKGNWPPGEVNRWPIAELSVFDGGDERVPVSDDAIVLPLRALFDEHGITLPDNFEAGEDKREEAVIRIKQRLGEIQMNEEIKSAVAEALAARDAEAQVEAEKEAAMRAKIEAELKEKPAYRSTFNIGGKHAKKAKLSKEDEEAGFDLADVEQNDEYLWSLRNPLQSGIGRKNAKRDLDETTAAEGLPIVPDKTLHKLTSYRQAKSFGRQAGMTIYQTDSLVLDIPMATTSIIALPAIAEEAVYTDLEPVLATVTATIEKHGGYVDVTEEFREDQNLFEPWLYKSIGEALGLAENVSIAAVILAGAGVANAAVNIITKPEVMAWYHALAGEYRPEACRFMNDDLLAYLRANESANSPTYTGGAGFSWALGERPQEVFMGHRVFTNGNFTAFTGAAAATEVAAFANLKAGYAFVERRGINILVDPYIGGLNGIVRYYFSARYDFVEVDPNATALKNGGP